MTVAKLPPVVKGLPVLGSIPQLLTDFPKLLLETAPATGDIARIKVGFSEMYVVSNPEYLQHILRDGHKNYIRGSEGGASFRYVSGDGLITLEGEEWLHQRRMLQPYFHRRYLPRIIELMAQTIDYELDALEKLIGSGLVDMVPKMRRMTLSVFLRSLASDHPLTDEDIDQMGEVVDTGIRINMARDRIGQVIPRNIKLPMDRQIAKRVVDFDAYVERIIDNRIENKNEDDDLLGLLLSAEDEDGKKLSRKQLRDEIKSLIVAGYDTTSATLQWTTILMNKHPEVAQKVADEANSVYNGDVTMETVQALEYTHWVWNETLRVRPVAWGNNRVTAVDDVIDGYLIPEGKMIIIPIYHLHHDPRFWDDPETFNPERWAEDNGGAKHRFAYMPYSAGPRKCLGEHFAIAEGVLVLSKMMRRFNITPVPSEPEEVNYNFTMAPTAIPARIKPRN